MSGDDHGFFDRVGSRAASNGSNARFQSLPGGPPTHSGPTIEKASCWAQSDNVFHGIGAAHAGLPPGMYRCAIDDRHGPVFLKQQIDLDGIVPLPDSASAEVIREIKDFRAMKERFSSHGFLHKRGILLWGPAGSGKTVTVHQVTRLIVGDEGGIALLVGSPFETAHCLQLLRRIEPDRPVVAIFEDLDALIARFGENEYLALLDGEAQVDNIVFIATTNYPEDLDARFVDRPSRFDTVRYIGMPNPEARATYLRAKAPALVNGQLEAFVQASEGFSIAHLKELVVLTQCFGHPLHEAAARIGKMKVKPNGQRSPDHVGAGL